MNDLLTDDALDLVLHALADPTRRAILRRLSGGDERVTTLAEPFPISLNSVSKHIQTLEHAGLVTRRRVGREHMLSLESARLDDIAAWVDETRDAWGRRLVAMDRVLTERLEHPAAAESIESIESTASDTSIRNADRDERSRIAESTTNTENTRNTRNAKSTTNTERTQA
jgi:DNA-binding transcriptional ArsR family regulator